MCLCLFTSYLSAKPWSELRVFSSSWQQHRPEFPRDSPCLNIRKFMHGILNGCDFTRPQSQLQRETLLSMSWCSWARKLNGSSAWVYSAAYATEILFSSEQPSLPLILSSSWRNSCAQSTGQLISRRWLVSISWLVSILWLVSLYAFGSL